MFTNDYIMRQIEQLAGFLVSVLFNKDIEIADILEHFEDTREDNFLYHQLMQMVYSGRINAAENLLFDTIQPNPTMEHLATALYFYNELQNLDDTALQAADFSREEIQDGLQAVLQIYQPYIDSE